MSDEFDVSHDNRFSPFWPMLIVVLGLFLWFGLQDYELNRQRGVNDQQLQSAIPAVGQAQAYASRYVALMKDLVEDLAKESLPRPRSSRMRCKPAGSSFSPTARTARPLPPTQPLPPSNRYFLVAFAGGFAEGWFVDGGLAAGRFVPFNRD